MNTGNKFLVHSNRGDGSIFLQKKWRVVEQDNLKYLADCLIALIYFVFVLTALLLYCLLTAVPTIIRAWVEQLGRGISPGMPATSQSETKTSSYLRNWH